MRDILLTVVLVVLLYKTLRKAEVGAYLWTWLSLMNPHRMTYGFALNLPWAQISALTTLVSLIFAKNRKPLPMNGGVIALILLWVWMTITSAFSINPSDVVWARWVFVSKIYLMLLVTLVLIRERQQTNVMVWIVVVSIGFFGFKGGIFTLLTGGAFRVWGPPGSMVEENNSLAVALIIILPLAYYLWQTSDKRWMRLGLACVMFFVGISILGSQSRGALLGLLAMATMLGLKSQHPIRFSLVLVALLAAGISFMPDSWTERMNTIQSYEDEGSAFSRIYTWHTLLNVALDRPLVGAGFGAENLSLFARYAPTDPEYAVFQGNSWVAHSIYMQALGEHGFVGLALYLFIWMWVWRTASKVAKQAELLPDLKQWLPLLMRMCQVSTIGFCVGGAFLSLMAFDLPYYLLVFVTLGQCAVGDRLRGARSQTNSASELAGSVGPQNVGAFRSQR